MYNVQIRDESPDGLHADWAGRHAAATYLALQAYHRSERSQHPAGQAVRQVEWGAYECTLLGHQIRLVIERALRSPLEWRTEPLETLDIGHTRLVGSSGTEPRGSRTLGWLHDHLQDTRRYLLTAEVFE